MKTGTLSLDRTTTKISLALISALLKLSGAKVQAATSDTVKVFIELRDINYPGLTYDLAYQAESDQLTGIYYQAALQPRFEVNFLRMQ